MRRSLTNAPRSAAGEMRRGASALGCATGSNRREWPSFRRAPVFAYAKPARQARGGDGEPTRQSLYFCCTTHHHLGDCLLGSRRHSTDSDQLRHRTANLLCWRSALRLDESSPFGIALQESPASQSGVVSETWQRQGRSAVRGCFRAVHHEDIHRRLLDSLGFRAGSGRPLRSDISALRLLRDAPVEDCKVFDMAWCPGAQRRAEHGVAALAVLAPLTCSTGGVTRWMSMPDEQVGHGANECRERRRGKCPSGSSRMAATT
jgi:hypothetical protein